MLESTELTNAKKKVTRQLDEWGRMKDTHDRFDQSFSIDNEINRGRSENGVLANTLHSLTELTLNAS